VTSTRSLPTRYGLNLAPHTFPHPTAGSLLGTHRLATHLFLPLFWLSLTCPSACGVEKLTEGTTILFATPERGREILCRRDDYVERLSPFDRSARLKTAEPVSEEAYLAYVGMQLLPWNASEREKVLAVIRELNDPLDALRLPLPVQLVMIKTTGREEGGAAYTRANAIVLTESHLRREPDDLKRLICHELFHVMSRADPSVRDGLYAAIGFRRCGEPPLPAALRQRQITNPDAPVNDHCIDVVIDGTRRTVVPVLVSESERYDPARGGEFFEYLRLRFLAVEEDTAAGTSEPLQLRGQLLLVPVTELRGFFEQVGRNTGYIIHPEEILADNFAHLMMNTPNLESPQIVSRMRSLFAELRLLGG
jgi:hypothetical protein